MLTDHEKGMQIFRKYAYDANLQMNLIQLYFELSPDDEVDLLMLGWTKTKDGVWEYIPLKELP